MMDERDVHLEHRLSVIEVKLGDGFKRIDERMGRVEYAVEALDDQVRQQTERVAVIEGMMPTAAERDEHAEMWSSWRFARWLVPWAVPALATLGATLGIALSRRF